MAGDWIKLRTDLHSNLKVVRLADSFQLLPEEIVRLLYKLASWFRTHGKYGQIDCDPSVIDAYLKQPGISLELQQIDWLRVENGMLILRGFTDVSSIRKGLGAELRRQVLRPGCICVWCGAASNLVIDHKIPISRGGTSEISNLQVMCRKCNSSKGTKTMEEFIGDRRS